MPRRGLDAFTGMNLALLFLAWFIVSDLGLILLLDRVDHDFRGGVWVIYSWMVLHFAINPVLACIVAIASVAQAVRASQGAKLATTILLAPVLLMVAYLGFSRNFRLLEFLGLTMRG